jgi:hypothetical protein
LIKGPNDLLVRQNSKRAAGPAVHHCSVGQYIDLEPSVDFGSRAYLDAGASWDHDAFGPWFDPNMQRAISWRMQLGKLLVHAVSLRLQMESSTATSRHPPAPLYRS